MYMYIFMRSPSDCSRGDPSDHPVRRIPVKPGLDVNPRYVYMYNYVYLSVCLLCGSRPLCGSLPLCVGRPLCGRPLCGSVPCGSLPSCV